MLEFGAEKGLVHGHASRMAQWVTHARKSPELPEGFQQGIFKGNVRQRHGGLLPTTWCRNGVFLQLALFKSVHHVSVNLQQDKCCSLFCNFLSPYEGKSVTYTLKGQSLKTGLFCRLQAVDNILCFFLN